MHSLFLHTLEVSSQLHILEASPLSKEPFILVRQKAGWIPKWPGYDGKENSLSLTKEQLI
jgi:hypothetical protein